MSYKYTVTVKGMMCGMCESHINDVVRKAFNDVKVTSNRHKKETVIISDISLDKDKILEVINQTGYTASDVVMELYTKKSLLDKLFKK